MSGRTFGPTDAAAGPPGVWFLSLDAENPYVVAGGRALFHVPYARARITIQDVAGAVDYRSRRTHRDEPSARFRARYRRTGDFTLAAVGSLDAWLTARFAVYAADRHGGLFRGDIRHDAWRLAPAEWSLRGETLLSALQLSRPDAPPILRMADDVDVLAAWPHRVPG